MKSNEKSIFVLLVIIFIILILFAIFYLDYLRLVNDIFSRSVEGFSFVRPKISTLSLTTDGNLTMEFMNLWPGAITILNLSAKNNESVCIIPKENLPLTVSIGNSFIIHGFNCVGFKKTVKKDEKFHINMTIEYIIGEEYMVSYSREAIHKEFGRLEGGYT